MMVCCLTIDRLTALEIRWGGGEDDRFEFDWKMSYVMCVWV